SIDSMLAERRAPADVLAAARRAFDSLWRALSVALQSDEDCLGAERLAHASRLMFELVQRFPDVVVEDAAAAAPVAPSPPRAALPESSSDERLAALDDDASSNSPERMRDARSSRIALRHFVLERMRNADQILLADKPSRVSERVVPLL